MIYRPENVMFMGFGLYILVLILSPVDPQIGLESGTLFFIGLCTAALVLGSRVADTFPVFSARSRVGLGSMHRSELKLFWFSLIVGAFGNILRLVDKYFLREVGFTTGLEARELLIDNATTPLSLLGGALYPFGYIPIFVLLGSKFIPRNKWNVGISIVVFLIPALDALVLFSRSTMLVSLAMVYFGVSLTLFRGRMLPRQLVAPLLAGTVILFSLSAVVFAWRLDQMGFGVSRSIFISGYAYTVPPNASIRALINNDTANGDLIASLVAVAQYYVHSIFELQILLDMKDTQVFSWGALHFGPYYKALALLGIVDQPNLFELFPRVGVFTSYWGPLWVDFGWYSPVLMFVAGLFARRVAARAEAGGVGAYPLYTYLCVILFFMPVVNFAISAQGMYVINAFVIFWLATKRLDSASAVKFMGDYDRRWGLRA